LLLARAEQPGVADLFLPGDASYLAELQRQTKRVAERANLAYLLPCIVVARGNPKKIASVADLAQPGVRVALGNPEACQVGRAADTLLRKAGIDPAAIDPKYGLTVSEVGLWVKVGDVDAAIVWDATAVDLGGAVEVVAVPVDSALVSRVDIAMLTDARNPEVARQFIEFCTGPRARGILRRKGYRVDAPLELETPAAPQGGSE
jgi:molybdate transport system substrate-binding protein